MAEKLIPKNSYLRRGNMKEKLLSLILILVLVVGLDSVEAGSIVTAKCDNCGYDSGGLFSLVARQTSKLSVVFRPIAPTKRRWFS